MHPHEQRKLTPAKGLQTFLNAKFPEAEPLIEGLLYRRDLVAVQGRRREGKTTLLMQVGLSLAAEPCFPFLGRTVQGPRRVLMYLLEDDARQLQDRFSAMLRPDDDDDWKEHLEFLDEHGKNRAVIRTREDFMEAGIPRNALNATFQGVVESDCQDSRPDLIIFDNLGVLINADYSEHNKIAQYTNFVERLSNKFNCAVITATHLRKNDRLRPVDILKSGDAWFEENIGSSHFMNSHGSMWGLQKSSQEDGTTFFRGGAQRRFGFSNLIPLHLINGWFDQADDFAANCELVLRTQKRKDAWEKLPSRFTFSEAESAVKGVLSQKAFANLWSEMKHTKLIMPVDGARVYRKADSKT